MPLFPSWPSNALGPSSAAASEIFAQDGNDEKLQEDSGKTPTTKNDLSDLLKVILERIGESEERQKQQIEAMAKASAEQWENLQNDQKTLLEKISELEKQQQKKEQRKKLALKGFQMNRWDASACHGEVEIIGDKQLTVRHKGMGWSSVFAEELGLCSADIFYFEISVKRGGNYMVFGLADKQNAKKNWPSFRCSKSTYAFECNGNFYNNGSWINSDADSNFGTGDNVGIGINLATRRMIFTKNRRLLDSPNFDPPPVGFLFPFICLLNFGDEIEANFGPNFVFNLATL